jgi:hypothetical protein
MILVLSLGIRLLVSAEIVIGGLIFITLREEGKYRACSPRVKHIDPMIYIPYTCVGKSRYVKRGTERGKSAELLIADAETIVTRDIVCNHVQ